LIWVHQKITLEPNAKNTGIFENGVTKKINYTQLKTQPISFKTAFIIKGAGELQFIPIAKQTKANIKSAWSSPSFNGEFLPDAKEKVKKGFNASWSIPLTQRLIPMSWLNNQIDIKGYGFGVDLLLPVNNYSTADRTVKYAILIIGLTFLVFFFIENIKGRRIHPLQYILVGFSLVLFYALLVSFSEHIDFNLAYLIASLMTTSIDIALPLRRIKGKQTGRYYIRNTRFIVWVYFRFSTTRRFRLINGKFRSIYHPCSCHVLFTKDRLVPEEIKLYKHSIIRRPQNWEHLRKGDHI
jgi:inner membrane protein involved in colicin E2 resistance